MRSASCSEPGRPPSRHRDRRRSAEDRLAVEKGNLIEPFVHPYSREGWGLTHDDKSLIASDGTANLYFLDPATLAEKKRITVHDGGHEVRYLNELEYIDGRVYANIYWSDRIAIIDPENGLVTGWIDLSNLRAVISKDDPEMVANGNMYDRQGKRLFVTGKFWPNLFEIRLVPDS